MLPFPSTSVPHPAATLIESIALEGEPGNGVEAGYIITREISGGEDGLNVPGHRVDVWEAAYRRTSALDIEKPIINGEVVPEARKPNAPPALGARWAMGAPVWVAQDGVWPDRAPSPNPIRSWRPPGEESGLGT